MSAHEAKNGSSQRIEREKVCGMGLCLSNLRKKEKKKKERKKMGMETIRNFMEAPAQKSFQFRERTEVLKLPSAGKRCGSLYKKKKTPPKVSGIEALEILAS